MKAVRPYTKTEQVQTTLTVEQRERLDAYAETQKVSRADAIRQLVLMGLRSGLQKPSRLDIDVPS